MKSSKYLFPLIVGLLIGSFATQPAYAVNITLSGDTITSSVTVTGSVTVADAAYDATTWNGSATVPTKNAVRDKFAALGTSPYFNVVDYGANGSDVTEDTTAINLAITACTNAGGGTVYFPKGVYRITTALALPVGGSFLGEGWDFTYGSEIYQVTPGATCINPANNVRGAIANLRIRSEGHGIDTTLTNNLSIRDVAITPAALHWGIYCDTDQGTFGDSFDLTISNLTISASNAECTCNGAMIMCHTVANQLNISGMNECLRVSGPANEINKARLESSIYAVRVGVQTDGSVYAGGGNTFMSISTEACTYGWDLQGATDCTFINCGSSAPHDEAYPYIGFAQYAWNLYRVQGCTFIGGGGGGNYPGKSCIEFGVVNNSTFINFSAGNNYYPEGSHWSNATASMGKTESGFTESNLFIGCKAGVDNVFGSPWNPADKLHGGLATAAVQTHSLQATNHLKPSVQGRNLSGIALDVTAGATSKSIAFQTSVAATIATATAATTGGAALADGTYYYRVSMLTRYGETAGSDEETVTVSGADNSVAITTSGTIGTGWAFYKKIYRGTESNNYDGYYLLPINTHDYTDIGDPFTVDDGNCPAQGTNSPNHGGEPNAEYEVFLTPNWLTTWAVMDKTTLGFKAHFGTAATAVYSTGTIGSSSATVTLTGGTWPLNIADGTITADAQTIAVASRTSDTVIVLDAAPSAPFSADTYTAQDFNKVGWLIVR